MQTIKQFVVTVRQPIVIGCRKCPDDVDRHYTVYAKNPRGARRAIIAAGHPGTVVGIHRTD